MQSIQAQPVATRQDTYPTTTNGETGSGSHYSQLLRQIKTAGSAVPANALYLQQAQQTGSKELAKP